MTAREAFWLALATVGIPAVLMCLLWGLFLYLIGSRVDERLFYISLSFVVLIVLFVSPHAYRFYLSGKAAGDLTRDHYLKRAITSGCLAAVYAVLGFMHPLYDQKSAKNWLVPAFWIISTLYQLNRAAKADQTRYIPNE